MSRWLVRGLMAVGAMLRPAEAFLGVAEGWCGRQPQLHRQVQLDVPLRSGGCLDSLHSDGPMQTWEHARVNLCDKAYTESRCMSSWQ